MLKASVRQSRVEGVVMGEVEIDRSHKRRILWCIRTSDISSEALRSRAYDGIVGDADASAAAEDELVWKGKAKPAIGSRQHMLGSIRLHCISSR